MIEEVKQALNEIDGTPWRIGTASPNGLQNVGTKMGVMVCQTFNKEDAHLIANAPTWLRWQNERIEELQKELAAEKSASEYWRLRLQKETKQ